VFDWVTREVMNSVEAGREDADTMEVTTLVVEGSTVVVLGAGALDDDGAGDVDEAAAEEKADDDSEEAAEETAATTEDERNAELWTLAEELAGAVDIVRWWGWDD